MTSGETNTPVGRPTTSGIPCEPRGELMSCSKAAFIYAAIASSAVCVGQELPGSSLKQGAAGNSNSIQLRITESIVISRQSAKPGWADVGSLVAGRGRGVLVSSDRPEQPVSFTYTNCPGVVTAPTGISSSVKWKTTDRELIIAVVLEGGMPRPEPSSPQYGNCTLEISKAPQNN